MNLSYTQKLCSVSEVVWKWEEGVMFLKKIIGICFIVFVLMISGCEQNSLGKLYDQHEKVVEFFEKNKVGKFADYAVFKISSPPSFAVIVIFGFYENLKVCNEIKDKLNIKEPNSYECRPVNH